MQESFRFYPETAGGFFRYLGGAVVIGIGIGFATWIGHPHAPLVANLAVSVYIAFWVFLFAVAFARLLVPIFRRFDESRQRLLVALLCFTAGAAGWMTANLTLPVVTLGRWRITTFDWTFAVVFAGGVGLVTGVGFFTYALLTHKLRESVARLKEGEFAERELITAREIQQRLLPPASISGDGYLVAARNFPARVVAGDFYDVFPSRDGTPGIVVADVSGKGLGASLLMASVKSMIPPLARDHGPASTMTALNRDLGPLLGPRAFVAACFVTLDPGSGAYEIANAGLPDAYILRQGAPPSPIEVPGERLPLGARSTTVYSSVTGNLKQGERILILTDGIPEAETAAGELLGYHGLESILGDLEGDPDTLLDTLCARVTEATGDRPREDDWTALVLERL